ncbi:16S rRNA (cytosine(1402)-N(4))-methyltransferase RsmH [Candidatus Dojkabacteria bacterium]|nr:16S rRNA (cytosine(1402)-N(4))-methyltransferase RsmH [Candidatus Dojkabacteria bacterium]
MNKHIPVLLDELINKLSIKPGDNIIDATLGGGGHALEAIEHLDRKGNFVGIDVDKKAINDFGDLLKRKEYELVQEKIYFKDKLKIYLVKDNFRNINNIIERIGIDEVSVIYADLGFSTNQLEENLSFKGKGKLDLRMDESLQVTARDLVNGMYQKELEDIFRQYADEKLSQDIAKQIIQERQNSKITTKEKLREIIQDVVQKKRKDTKRLNKTEQRIFQALRISVNDELNALRELCDKSFDLLSAGGKLGIISFHSGEDRIVKHKMKDWVKSGKCKWVNELIRPTNQEIKKNPKSRSAKLRIVRKSGDNN